MRRRLAIASIIGFVIAGFGLGLLLLIGGPGSAPAAWFVIFVVTLLALIAAIITGVFGIVLPIFGRSARPVEVSEAAAAGREGFARVLTAVPTGAQINGSYVYDVDLVVDGTRAPAYRTLDRIRVHRRDGVLRGGEIIGVVRLRDDAPQVAVITGPTRSPQDALVPHDAPPWA
ncbi:MAG: hypothetical protein ABI566_04025 [Pseudolysinimonas sp.]